MNQPTVANTTLGFWLLLVIATFFLWTEHRAHLLGILPFLILLVCPFIHLFMHRGRGHGRQQDHEAHARCAATEAPDASVSGTGRETHHDS